MLGKTRDLFWTTFSRRNCLAIRFPIPADRKATHLARGLADGLQIVFAPKRNSILTRTRSTPASVNGYFIQK